MSFNSKGIVVFVTLSLVVALTILLYENYYVSRVVSSPTSLRALTVTVLPETDGSPSLIETMSYREYTEPTSREITLPSTKEITIPSSTENIHLTTPSTIEKVLSHNTEETLSTDTTISQSTLNFEKAHYNIKNKVPPNRERYHMKKPSTGVNFCKALQFYPSYDSPSSSVIHSQSSKEHNNHDSNWYSLTGRSGPSVNTIQNKMRECSLAMGVSQKSLVSNDTAINIIATNISVFLNALSAIIPQQFSSKYHSPCWKSPIVISEQLQKELSPLSKQRISMLCVEHIYQSVFVPALNNTKESLMCLPAFFLAGFPKCGTTTLHSILYIHMMISQPAGVKEPHWWTRIPLQNTEQEYLLVAIIRYLDHYYRQANSVIKKQPQILTYDASQSTLWDSHFLIDNQDYCAMPIVLSHILPSAKFIVVMRDPVARTYSHFVYECTSAREQLPSRSVFHERVIANMNHFKNCLLRNQSIYECAKDKYFTRPLLAKCGVVGFHLTTSMYYLHLSKWMQFFPRENFLFIRTEDMSSDPYTFMRSITNFLNIDEFPYPIARLLSTRKENVQNYTKMLPETQAILSEFFHPFNEKLVQLIGDKRFLWDDTQY